MTGQLPLGQLLLGQLPWGQLPPRTITPHNSYLWVVVLRGNCPTNRGNCPRGNCPTGVIVLGGSCPGGDCPRGSPMGVMVLLGNFPRGSCPWGSCPRSSCPRTLIPDDLEIGSFDIRLLRSSILIGSEEKLILISSKVHRIINWVVDQVFLRVTSNIYKVSINVGTDYIYILPECVWRVFQVINLGYIGRYSFSHKHTGSSSSLCGN